MVTIHTKRTLPAPIGSVWFYEISPAGRICYSCAKVAVAVTGNGHAAGAGRAAGPSYLFKAPSRMCLNGSNQRWAAFLIPTTGASAQAKHGYGGVGTFTIASCPPLGGSEQSSARMTCAPGPADATEVSPSTVKSGGSTVSLLYSCATSLNFENPCCAPLTVAMYNEASFRKLVFADSRFQAGPGVSAPIFSSYRIAGPDDLNVTIPAGLGSGTYALVVHNKLKDVAWSFLTVT
jgi:hypothetical protein